MKIRNYEKFELIIATSILFLILLIFFIIYTFNNKIYTYQTIQALVVDKNKISIVVHSKEKRKISQNNVFYINNKKKKYTLLEVEKIANETTKEYYNLILKLPLNEKYKLNDILKIEIQNKKIRIIEIFKVIWESD